MIERTPQPRGKGRWRPSQLASPARRQADRNGRAALALGESAAPPVLLSELRNVLLGLVRQGSLILDQARAMCDDAARVLGPRIVTVSSDRALDTALACGM